MSEHELWNELGNLYFLSGAYNQAANAYKRSIQLDAGFGRPYSNLALTYVQQGKYDEAIDLYRRSIELLIEDKEKATSWNRLGAVYRHLKDYSHAVIAFQAADELDPQNAEEFPMAEGPGSEPVQAPDSIVEESVVSPEDVRPEETTAEVEWWDVEESRSEPAAQDETEAAAPLEDPSASWTPADTTQFQQDLSQMPETGSLTTSGDGDLEDEFEVWPPLEPAPDLDIPDPDEEDLSTWLPLPEEEAFNLDQIQIPPFFDELEPEPAPPAEWQEPPSFQLIDAAGPVPPLETSSSVSVVAELIERNEPLQSEVDQHRSQPAPEGRELDIDVQERPAIDYALASVELPTAAPAHVMAPEIEPEPVAVIPPQPQVELHPAPEPAPVTGPEVLAAERDEDEVREIEMGIAKYRRVVQLNPRNPHAWDALGTLYKSAGQYKDAILAYQQAISNDPSRSLYYHHLGLVYACEGRDEDAISAFQRVIEIDPEYSLAHATLGGYYRKMGLEELAQKHIGKAMKNIFDSENEYNRACLEAICGNADQAIALLGVALKNKQTYVDWILRDPDLDFIRQDPRFKQLISEYTR